MARGQSKGTTHQRASARQQSIRRDSVQRILDLPEEEQIAAFTTLREHLEAKPPQQKLDEQAARRQEALAAMQRVADHLGLDDDGKRDLTMRQFDRAPKRVRNNWKAARVAAAWLTWPNAKRALLGTNVPVSFEKHQRETRIKQRERVREEQLRGLIVWLATAPASRTRRAYDQWRVGEGKQQGDDVQPVKSATLLNSFGLGWEALLVLAETVEPEPLDEPAPQDDATDHLDLPPDDRVIDSAILGPRLKAAREARGMSKGELTELAGLHAGQIDRIERQERSEPNFWTMARLAIALRVPLDYFVEPEGTLDLSSETTE